MTIKIRIWNIGRVRVFKGDALMSSSAKAQITGIVPCRRLRSATRWLRLREKYMLSTLYGSYAMFKNELNKNVNYWPCLSDYHPSDVFSWSNTLVCLNMNILLLKLSNMKLHENVTWEIYKWRKNFLPGAKLQLFITPKITKSQGSVYLSVGH